MSRSARLMTAWARGLLVLEAQEPALLERYVRLLADLSDEHMRELAVSIVALGLVNEDETGREWIS